jgi:hypothetical protein
MATLMARTFYFQGLEVPMKIIVICSDVSLNRRYLLVLILNLRKDDQSEFGEQGKGTKIPCAHFTGDLLIFINF